MHCLEFTLSMNSAVCACDDLNGFLICSTCFFLLGHVFFCLVLHVGHQFIVYIYGGLPFFFTSYQIGGILLEGYLCNGVPVGRSDSLMSCHHSPLTLRGSPLPFTDSLHHCGSFSAFLYLGLHIFLICILLVHLFCPIICPVWTFFYSVVPK